MLRATIRVLLVLTALLGLAREGKARLITADLRAGVGPVVDGETLAIINSRVGDRFVEGSGLARERTRPWILRTAADALQEGGGQCGDAVEAMGAVLDVMGVPFRILHVDVRKNGANHVMIEARADDGRWLLFDPLRHRAFRDPERGKLLSLDEVRALPLDARLRIDPLYVTKWPLHAPVRRSPVSDVETVFSGKALMMEPGAEVGLAALVIAGWMGGSRRKMRVVEPA